MSDCGESSACPKVTPINCKFCRSEGLMLFPLRYGVIGADNLSDIGELPKLGGNLGNLVSDKAIKNSKYAVRMLREGYLYTLEEREGKLTWTGYKINERGQLYEFEVDKPAPLKNKINKCDIGRPCGANAVTVSIPLADQVTNFYLLYTADPLSDTKLDEYKQNAASYAGEGKMQLIKPADWVGGNQSQPHTIKPNHLSNHVLEYQLFDKKYISKQDIFESTYGKALQNQLFPPIVYNDVGNQDKTKEVTVPAAFKRLGVVREKLAREKGAAIVLFDPIGITQELNNYRNDAFTQVDRYMLETDPEGVSNNRKLIVFNKIEEVRLAMRSGILHEQEEWVKNAQEYRKEALAFCDYQIAAARQANNKALEEAYTQRKAELDLKYQHQIAAAENSRADYERKADAKWNDKYERHLNRVGPEGINEFLDKLSKEKDKMLVIANARADDHLLWIRSKQLVDAFDTYDRKYVIPKTEGAITTDALGFSTEFDACIFGMEGCKNNDVQLEAWITASKIDRNNLFLRSYAFNSQEIEDHINAGFAAIGSVAGLGDASEIVAAPGYLKVSKKIIDVMKKMDAAFDEAFREKSSTKNPRNAKAAEKFYTKAWDRHVHFKMAMISRTIFRIGMGGTIDQTIVARMSSILYPHLGELVEKIAEKEFIQVYKKEHPPSNSSNKAEKKVDKVARQAAREPAMVMKETVTVNKPFDEVLENAKAVKKARQDKISNTLEEYWNNKQTTNNYHHTRISLVLASLELLSIGGNIGKWDKKTMADMAASAFTIASLCVDIRYNTLKTIRELDKYKTSTVKYTGANGKTYFKPTEGKFFSEAADIQRGGWKLLSGGLAAAAGAFSVLSDYYTFSEEFQKKRSDPVLLSLYVSRGLLGAAGTVSSALAAISYAAPWLENRGITRGVTYSVARFLAQRVGLLLFIARLNAIGLVITVIQVAYMLYKDNELQNWMDKCTFRSHKWTKWGIPGGRGMDPSKAKPVRSLTEHFNTLEEELAELDTAFAEVTGMQPNPGKQPAPAPVDTRTADDILNDPRNLIY